MNEVQAESFFSRIVEAMNANFINLTTTFHNKLESTITSLELRYKEELRERDSIIQKLTEKISTIETERQSEREELSELRESLKKSETSKYNRLYEDSEVVPEWNHTAKNDPDSGYDVTNAREQTDLLIAGDSCVKYLDVNRIHPSGKNNKLICIRGGKTEDIRNAIMEYTSTHNVAHCVVHVGTNHAPGEPPHLVQHKVISMLKEIRQNLPNTSIHFSAILPKYDVEDDIDFLPGINLINWGVRQHSTKIGYSFIGHPEFHRPNTRLICRDGVHPSYSGVAQMAMDIKRY